MDEKKFNVLKNYQDTIILGHTIYINETYVHEDKSKIFLLDEIGKVKKVKKQPRGIKYYTHCYRQNELFCRDSRTWMTNEIKEFCRKHIISDSHLIGDEDTSLTYTANEMKLERTMYKSNIDEAYKELEPIDKLCNQFKFFIN